jgi:hypothetical protein
MRGPEGGEMGVAGEEGEEGDLGKAEILKTETLNAERAIANSSQTGKAANRLDEVKGRMLRWTPRFGGIGRILRGVHLSRA